MNAVATIIQYITSVLLAFYIGFTTHKILSTKDKINDIEQNIKQKELQIKWLDNAHWNGKTHYYWAVNDVIKLPDSTMQKIENSYAKYSKESSYNPYPKE